MTSTLNTLKSNSGSRKKKLRKGRGIAAGQGASCGFGMRGQKSRSGRPTRPGFEGGQMPLYRRLPKRGFNPIKKSKIAKVNLSIIQTFLDEKKLSSTSSINIESLKKAKIIRKKFDKFKLLGDGELKSKLIIEADYASKSAVQKLEKIGGKITLKKSK